MIRNKKVIFPVVILCLSLGLYHLIDGFSPKIVQTFFENQSWDILNRVTGSVENQSLDYYQGRWEDIVFGPLKSVLSGIGLLFFCLALLPQAPSWILGVTIFLFLLATKWGILFNPPYGETIIGHFSDTVWLARHSFDYPAYFQLEGLSSGGPQHYPTSIFPSFLAVLMRITPSATSFLFINHLLVFAASASVIGMTFSILKQFFKPQTSLLGALLLFSLPLYHSMTEVLNFEIPTLFFAILTALFLVQRNLVLASFMSVMALLIKAPGGILCAAAAFASLLFCIKDHNPKTKWIHLLGGGIVLILAFAKALIRSSLVGEQPSHNRISLLAGWGNIKALPIFWMFCLTLVIFIFYLIKNAIASQKEGKGFIQNLLLFDREILLFSIAALWFLLYMNFSVMGPRYKLLVAPFLIFTLIYAVHLSTRLRKWLPIFLVATLLLSFLGSHGLYYPNKVESSIYSYNFLERSLEYRNDLSIHQRTAQELETNYADYQIGAPFVVAQMLVMPELGYISRPLDVMIYGNNNTVEGLALFKGLDSINILQTIWVGFEKNHITDKIDYPIDRKKDKVIKEVAWGDKKIVFFMGGFAIERMRRILLQYLKKIKDASNLPTP